MGTRTCRVYGCDREWFCYGRCRQHYASLKASNSSMYRALKKLTRAERQAELEKAAAPSYPKWEWPGDEEALFAMQESSEDKLK